MARPAALTVVSPDAQVRDLMRVPETPGARIARLQNEARALACEHAEAFAALMNDLTAMARDIESGGSAYPSGVREIAASVSRDLPGRVLNLQALAAR